MAYGYNVDPIARAITNLGEMSYRLALAKQTHLRNLGRDIYEANLRDSQTALNRAKIADQELKTQNTQKLSNFFDPSVYTDRERANLGAGAMLGSKSLNDIMKGADVQQAMRYKAEQYQNGDQVTKLSVALGKQIKPYDVQSGYLFNNMTGFIKEAPGYDHSKIGSSKSTGSSANALKIARPTELKTVFSKQITTKDPITMADIVKTVPDQEQTNAFLNFAYTNGLPVTIENAYKFRSGILQDEVFRARQATRPESVPRAEPSEPYGSPEAITGANPLTEALRTAPQATPAPSTATPTPAQPSVPGISHASQARFADIVKSIPDANLQASVMGLQQQLINGRLGPKEFEQKLKELFMANGTD